ncbi:MAG: M15 family metallopeptidase [Ruminococcus sp.]|jgi:D-alanyl-D-alanine carboxypeptidase
MNSYVRLINKEHRLSETYVPKDLTESIFPFCAPKGNPKKFLRKEAADWAALLFAQAKWNNIHLFGVSAYRSYSRQQQLYEERMAFLNYPADNPYIAPPGASEHQSGLALDVSCASVNYELVEDFAYTSEGKWLSQNAALFGFILRYPSRKTEITGYAWEPWHIRYVTRSLALYLTLTGLTLEEFYQMEAG